MDTNTAPKLTLMQRATLAKAEKVQAKAKKKGLPVFHKVYWVREMALLQTHGWTVHTHTPVSYGAPESWLMTRREA